MKMLLHSRKATSFLVELRYRVTYYFFGFLCAFIFAYYQKDILLYRLFRSLNSLNSSSQKLRNKSFASDGILSPYKGETSSIKSVPSSTADVMNGSAEHLVNEAILHKVSIAVVSPTTSMEVTPTLGQGNEVIFLEITEAFYTELYMIFVISFFYFFATFLDSSLVFSCTRTLFKRTTFSCFAELVLLVVDSIFCLFYRKIPFAKSMGLFSKFW